MVVCGLLQGVQTVRTQTVTLSRSLDNPSIPERRLGTGASVPIYVHHATTTDVG